jgi:hypothetical protein
MFIFAHFGPEQIPILPRFGAGVVEWGPSWYYLVRQATTILKFANSTTNPQLAAVLIEKAADLKSQVDETSTTPDPGPLAPDVEPPA